MKPSKTFQKTALIGPTLDLVNLGIPSAIGYLAGSSGVTDAEAEQAANRRYSIPAGVFIPGYTGYHFGAKREGERRLARMRQEAANAEKTSAIRTAAANATLAHFGLL